MDQKTTEKFYERAQAIGFDKESACVALGVNDASQYRGGIGQALNVLAQAKNAQDNGSTALVHLPDDERRALYVSDELARFGESVRAIAPWANNSKHPVTDQEIALVVMRGHAMGLDVLNPHDVSVIKTKDGIQFQLAYTVMAQWMEQIHGGHLKPRYRLLSDEEKDERGIAKANYACECTFLMKSDIPRVKEMIDSGAWTPQEARAELAAHGIATASAKEWGSSYFEPSARDKMFKLEKRAYTDAVRRRFGTPGAADIAQMRHARGEGEIALDDWQAAANEPDNTRAEMARFNAATSNREPITDAEFAENVNVLRGESFDDITDLANGGETVSNNVPPTMAEIDAAMRAVGPTGKALGQVDRLVWGRLISSNDPRHTAELKDAARLLYEHQGHVQAWRNAYGNALDEIASQDAQVNGNG